MIELGPVSLPPSYAGQRGGQHNCTIELRAIHVKVEILPNLITLENMDRSCLYYYIWALKDSALRSLYPRDREGEHCKIKLRAILYTRYSSVFAKSDQ